MGGWEDRWRRRRGRRRRRGKRDEEGEDEGLRGGEELGEMCEGGRWRQDGGGKGGRGGEWGLRDGETQCS